MDREGPVECGQKASATVLSRTPQGPDIIMQKEECDGESLKSAASEMYNAESIFSP